MTSRNATCPKQCLEQCSEQMLDAMHGRTYGRTNGETTHLVGPISPLATRTGAYENRDSSLTTGGLTCGD